MTGWTRAPIGGDIVRAPAWRELIRSAAGW